MAKKTKGSKKSRKHRTDAQILAELEARLSDLQRGTRDGRKFSPKILRDHRERLELSAADYAALVGVSPLTIYNWEKGKTTPRPSQLSSWIEMRGMGKREAWRILDEMEA